MLHSRRSRRTRLSLGAALLAGGFAMTAHAAPTTGDPDFEAVAPAAQAATLTSAERHGPPGLTGSPLAIPDHATLPQTRMRFAMRDGEVLIAQVLAFDGQMYALRLPHATILARKDLFVSIKPAPLSQPRNTRTARAQ